MGVVGNRKSGVTLRLGSRGLAFRVTGLMSSRELGPMGSKGAGPHGHKAY